MFVTSPPGPDPILTADEVARLLRVHVKHVRDLPHTHQIPSRRVGRSYRFSRAAIMAWLDAGPTLTRLPKTRSAYERPPF